MTGELAARRRLVLGSTALVLVAIDLVLKRIVENALADGPGPDYGIVKLRLVFNPGVAYSFGGTAPRGVVAAVTSLILLGVAIYAWRRAPSASPAARVALAAILAGGLGNLLDRVVDGVVTDYLRMRLFHTFNLADMFLTFGVIVLVFTTPVKSSPT